MGAEGSAGDKADGSMVDDVQFVEEILGSSSVDYITVIKDWKD